MNPTAGYFLTVLQKNAPNFDVASTHEAIMQAYGAYVEDIQVAFEIGGKLGTPHWHWLVVLTEPIFISREEWYMIFAVETMSIKMHNPKREPLGRFLFYVEPYITKGRDEGATVY